MASISKVELWEDVAGNVIGLVFDPAGQLTNAVQNLAAQQPLPRPALVEAARQAFPFAPTYDPHAFGERSLVDLYVYLHVHHGELMVMTRLTTMLLTTSITLTCPMAHTISMGMVQRYCPEYRKTVRVTTT